MKNSQVYAPLVAALAVGAAVWFTSRPGGDTLEAPTVDASVEPTPDGIPNFAFPDEATAKTLVEARARIAIEKATPVEVEAQKRPPPPATGAPGFIDVTVLDSSGGPVAGARVTMQSSTSDPRGWMRANSGSPTDAQGRTRMLSLPPGYYRAIATADGLAVGASEQVQITPTRASADVVIELNRGGSVEGELFDVRGDAAAGIGLSIHLTAWHGQIRGGTTSHFRQAEVQEDGSFRFDLLPAGRHRLYTRAEGEDLKRVPAQHLEVEVSEGQTTRVTFENLRDSFVELTGTVLRDDAPVAGARVNIHWADRTRGYLGRNAKTDEDGRFEVTLDEGGEYRFQVSDPLGASGSVFYIVTIPPESTHEIVISFSTGTISGHVYDPDGDPLAGVGLQAYGKPPGKGAEATFATAKTDPNGAYEFRFLLAATYKISAGSARISPGSSAVSSNPHAGGLTVTDLTIGPGDHLADIDLHLPAAASVAGIVTDREGNPAQFAIVEFWPESTAAANRKPISHVMVLKADSDQQGRFQIGGLEPGEYRVRAQLEREISPWIELQVRARTTAQATLVLDRGTMLTIEVYAAGQPAERCYVGVLDERGITVASTISNNGPTTLGPLLPGTYTVSAQENAREPKATQSVAVAGEDELTVRLSLP